MAGDKNSWLQSKIADFEHNRCFARQDMAKMDCATELSREKAVSGVSKGPSMIFFV